MKKFAKLTIVAIVALWFVGTANALPLPMIKGEIDMMGYGQPVFDLESATSVPAPWAMLVSLATEDFATVDGYPVSFVGFIFDPWTSSIDPLWSVGGFTFRLDSILVTIPRTADELNLVGSGILKHNSFSETPGNWFLNIKHIDSNRQESFFKWASATAVPEASILMLLGTGLIGVAFYTRRRK